MFPADLVKSLEKLSGFGGLHLSRRSENCRPRHTTQWLPGCSGHAHLGVDVSTES